MVISASMQTIDPNRLQVAVGVLKNVQGNYLIQQRLPSAPCPGQWEFPGGKIESGEQPRFALNRELEEELGIDVRSSKLLLVHNQDYNHAQVQLHVFLITDYSGKAMGREGQVTMWRSKIEIAQLDVLDAVHPILKVIS